MKRRHKFGTPINLIIANRAVDVHSLASGKSRTLRIALDSLNGTNMEDACNAMNWEAVTELQHFFRTQ